MGTTIEESVDDDDDELRPLKSPQTNYFESADPPSKFGPSDHHKEDATTMTKATTTTTDTSIYITQGNERKQMEIDPGPALLAPTSISEDHSRKMSKLEIELARNNGNSNNSSNSNSSGSSNSSSSSSNSAQTVIVSEDTDNAELEDTNTDTETEDDDDENVTRGQIKRLTHSKFSHKPDDDSSTSSTEVYNDLNHVEHPHSGLDDSESDDDTHSNSHYQTRKATMINISFPSNHRSMVVTSTTSAKSKRNMSSKENKTMMITPGPSLNTDTTLTRSLAPSAPSFPITGTTSGTVPPSKTQSRYLSSEHNKTVMLAPSDISRGIGIGMMTRSNSSTSSGSKSRYRRSRTVSHHSNKYKITGQGQGSGSISNDSTSALETDTVDTLSTLKTKTTEKDKASVPSFTENTNYGHDDNFSFFE